MNSIFLENTQRGQARTVVKTKIGQDPLINTLLFHNGTVCYNGRDRSTGRYLLLYSCTTIVNLVVEQRIAETTQNARQQVQGIVSPKDIFITVELSGTELGTF